MSHRLTTIGKVLLIAGCTLISASILAGLYYTSPFALDRINGGFSRSINRSIKPIYNYVSDLGVNSFYIAGKNDTHLFLGNATSPRTIIAYDLNTHDTTQHIIQYVGLDSITMPKQCRTIVRGQDFYVTNGLMPTVMKGNISDWRASVLFPKNEYFYMDAIPANENAFVLKIFNRRNQQLQLARVSMRNQLTFETKDMLRPQADSLFSMEGQLVYNAERAKIIYVYRYRNLFTIMDSTMSTKLEANTIDTISVAKIKMNKNRSTGEISITGGDNVVNNMVATYDSLLYIQSPLASSDTIRQVLLNNMAMDVYHIETGKYLYSFYLPKHEGLGPSSFRVEGNKIYAIYGKKLVTLELQKSARSITLNTNTRIKKLNRERG